MSSLVKKKKKEILNIDDKRLEVLSRGPAYDRFFNDLISELKNEGRYRVFTDLSRETGSFPRARIADNAEVTIWCSNDYLGMGQHPEVLDAMAEAIYAHGAGAGGTRNISGNHQSIVQLEADIAKWIGKEGALVFSSGYLANFTALNALGALLPECHIFSDALNHDSMIQGMRHSRAPKSIFAHNDTAHLEEMLAQHPLDTPKIIAFESVYSMEGDLGKIEEICALAKKYNALTYLDETHAVGLYGPTGAGVAELLGVTEKVDFIQGGLGKAVGVIGGFVCGSENAIDVIRSFGCGFIFTTALPPAVAKGASKSIELIKKSSGLREHFHETVALTRIALESRDISLFGEPLTHILPVLIGDSRRCKRIADELLKAHSIYLQPINYPTVPRGSERLRITPTPLHSTSDIEKLAAALSSELNKSE